MIAAEGRLEEEIVPVKKNFAKSLVNCEAHNACFKLSRLEQKQRHIAVFTKSVNLIGYPRRIGLAKKQPVTVQRAGMRVTC